MSTTETDTKSKILSAALELLEKNRGKNVRLEDVAKAARVSRQAVYLHFQSRIGLMVETVKYGDKVRDAAKQTEAWSREEGVAKLDAWVTFWGNYIPQIYGVAKALMMMRDTDHAAAAAWEDRMSDVRKGCRTTIESLAASGELAETWTVSNASDLLWTMLSIEGWERLTIDGGWSDKKYVKQMRLLTRECFVRRR